MQFFTEKLRIFYPFIPESRNTIVSPLVKRFCFLNSSDICPRQIRKFGSMLLILKNNYQKAADEYLCSGKINNNQTNEIKNWF